MVERQTCFTKGEWSTEERL